MSQQDHDITLGERVQDQISGFEGIVVTIGYHTSGCTRFGVQPVGEEGSSLLGDEEFFYEDQLDTVEGEDFTDAEFAEPGSAGISIGDLVRDGITGFEGVCIVENYKLYNCPQFAVSGILGSGNNDGVDTEWFDETRLTMVEAGAGDQYVETSGATAETGCTVDSAPSMDSP